MKQNDRQSSVFSLGHFGKKVITSNRLLWFIKVLKDKKLIPRKTKVSVVVSFFVFLLASVGLVSAFVLVKVSQDIRNKAAGSLYCAGPGEALDFRKTICCEGLSEIDDPNGANVSGRKCVASCGAYAHGDTWCDDSGSYRITCNDGQETRDACRDGLKCEPRSSIFASCVNNDGVNICASSRDGFSWCADDRRSVTCYSGKPNEEWCLSSERCVDTGLGGTFCRPVGCAGGYEYEESWCNEEGGKSSYATCSSLGVIFYDDCDPGYECSDASGVRECVPMRISCGNSPWTGEGEGSCGITNEPQGYSVCRNGYIKYDVCRGGTTCTNENNIVSCKQSCGDHAHGTSWCSNGVLATCDDGSLSATDVGSQESCEQLRTGSTNNSTTVSEQQVISVGGQVVVTIHSTADVLDNLADYFSQP